MNTRPPLPPFTEETARQKVQLAEDGWNSRDPERVALAYTEDSEWRNRSEFVNGRPAIIELLDANGHTNSTTACARNSGPLPATASPCGSSMNFTTPPASGIAPTATRTGSSLPTASCNAASPASTICPLLKPSGSFAGSGRVDWIPCKTPFQKRRPLP
jgi:hypothetical protein